MKNPQKASFRRRLPWGRGELCTLTKNSGSSRGTVGEASTTNRIEGNRIESYNIHKGAGASEEAFTDFEKRFKAFCEKWAVAADTYSPLLGELDLEKLDAAYGESAKFLQVAPVARTISWIIKNAASIYAGKYRDKDFTQGHRSRWRRSITEEWAETLAHLYGETAGIRPERLKRSLPRG